MRSEGYSSCPACVCLSVSPHAILAVRAITSKTTIVLSVEFEAIVKRRVFLKTSASKVRALLLGEDGHFVTLDYSPIEY